MQLRALREQLQADWKASAVYGALLAVAALLLGGRLGTLLPGFSPQELHTLQQSSNLHGMLQDPINAPYLLLVHLLSYVNSDYLLWGRIVSILCGMLALGLFCGLVWYWQGRRNAVLGTVLFATSAWFLHTARWGTPDVALLLILALIACAIWLHRTQSSGALLTAFALVAIACYIPGMVWFVVGGVLWRWRSIDQAFKKNLWAVSAGSVLLLGALAPLGYAIYRHPAIAKVLAGLPAGNWPQPLDVLHNLATIPFHLFVQGPVHPERWLGDVAVIDVFTTVMFILGAYLYCNHVKLKRVKLGIGVLIGGALLAALGGGVTLTLIVPFVYIIAAAGIGFMIDRWLEVFPRNGLAQGAGYILIGLAMLAACTYSLAHYFIAWPDAKATRMVYTEHQLPAHSDTIKE